MSLPITTAAFPATVIIRPAEPVVLTPGLDLILPCWNPSGQWVETLIQHYHDVVTIMGKVPVQLILVNDGSLKNFSQKHISWLEAAIPGIIVVDNKINRGKGYAIREGVKRSQHAYQVYTDLDFPFGVAAVKQVYDALQNGMDVVAGERGEAYLRELPRKRRIITRINRTMNKFILRLKVNDAQAGLKGFNMIGRDILLDTTIDGFLYDSEFMYRAGKRPRIRMAGVPVYCRPGITFSAFKMKLLFKELRNYLKIVAGPKTV
ncbi:glycosyltransferase [Chitinophaga sp. Cy-1792]|uniref:glycosyltransferase n=1 Tax=Chitinophaga sp. Cy-1792 TaxID=2608339 RepID=UPI0014203613|nr:glycosyltransferase [Chitinophaga sp. Cy-1792]NIG56979.1 glycosyltransferase [Chitinophaga sp. Cy-1792]